MVLEKRYRKKVVSVDGSLSTMQINQKFVKRFSVLYVIITVLGFVTHVSIISKEYSQYRVVNRMDLQVDNMLPVPKLSLCFRYTDIFDRKSPLFPSSFQNHTQWNKQQQEQEQSAFTVRQIFDLTPRTDEIFKSCLTRVVNSTKVISRNETECEAAFHVRKYFMQEYMCYDFESITYVRFPFIKTTKSLNYLNCIFVLNLSSKFNDTPIFVPIVYFDGEDVTPTDTSSQEGYSTDFPFFSRSFAKETFKMRNNLTGMPGANKFDIYHTWTKIYLLPRPYTTMCVRGSSQETCLRKCLLKALKRMNRVPFSEIISDSYQDKNYIDMKPIGPLDLTNSTIESFVHGSEQQCHSECTRQGCNHFYTLTSVYMTYDQNLKWTSQFRVMTPSAPALKMTFVAASTLSEFLIYISSCLGIWFGLNVLSMNPHPIGKLFRQKTNIIRRPRRGQLTLIRKYPLDRTMSQRWYCQDLQTLRETR